MCLYPRNALSECSGSDHTKYTGEHSGVGVTGKADRCGLMCAGLRGQGGLKHSISKKDGRCSSPFMWVTELSVYHSERNKKESCGWALPPG